MKVQTWVDGVENVEFVGVGARFGRRIVSKEKNANQTHLVFANPRDSCTPLKNKVFISPFFIMTYDIRIDAFKLVVMLKVDALTYRVQSLLAFWRCCYCGTGQL